MVTPNVSELSRAGHVRQVQLVRASLLRGVGPAGKQAKKR